MTLQEALAFQGALAREMDAGPTGSALLHYKSFSRKEESDYQFTDTELRLGVEMYLTNLPYSMWSDWEIKHPDRRRLAAEWLYDQIRSVIGVIEEASKAKRG